MNKLLLGASLMSAFAPLAAVLCSLVATTTASGLGACQGASCQQGWVYLYDDREVGVGRV